MSEQEGSNTGFEQAWKDAVGDANVTPPANVWSGISQSLTETKLVTLQKKTIYYKWAVAASIFLAASLGVWALSYQYPQWTTLFDGTALAIGDHPSGQRDQYAGFSILRLEEQSESPVKNTEEDLVAQVNTQLNGAGTDQDMPSAKMEQKPDPSNSNREAIPNLPAMGISSDLITPDQYGGMNSLFASPRERRALIELNDNRQLALAVPVDPIDVGTYGVHNIPQSIQKKLISLSGRGRFWCGVDVASGYFNPNYAPGVEITSQEVLEKGVGARESIPELSENMRGGASYSVGINFGMRLKDRWSIEAGAQYSLLGARTFTNLILESEGFNKAVAYSSEIAGLESVANLVESELTKLSVDDIQVSNTFQFMSFPVQAGYKLLDRRFNVTLNAGLAANLYLGNSLKGRRDFSSFDLQPGRRSPYRSLTLAGVAGFEMGYLIHPRVNVSFEPTYQKNLQSLTKNDSGFEANPSGVGVQVGFKYDF